MEDIKNLPHSHYQIEMEIAWKEYDENKLDEVKERVRKLIAVYPEKAACYYLLGHVALTEKQISEAIEQFNQALVNDIDGKSSGYIYYWLAKIYGIGGLFDDVSDSVYDRAKQLNYFKLARNAGAYPMQLLFDLRYELPKEERISLFEEGVAKFPDSVDPYLMLAQEYGSVGLINRQWTTLSNALERNFLSASLHYQVGGLKVAQEEFLPAIQYFEKTLELNSNGGSRFGIYYLLGRANYMANNLDQAEQYFRNAYEESSEDGDKLFGFFGLLQVYIVLGNSRGLEDLVSNLNINRSILNQDGRVFGGPLYLDGNDPVTIEIANTEELYQLLGKVKIQPKKAFFSGKLNLIRSFLATVLHKHYEAHKAITNAQKYLDRYRYPSVVDMHQNALENLVYYKFEAKTDVEKTLGIVLSDLSKHSSLGSFLANCLEAMIDVLYKARDFQNIIAICNFCDPELMFKADVLFEAAYSYSQVKNDVKAKVLYEYYLDKNPKSSAVLNNLALIHENAGNLPKAIELYSQGLVLEPTDTILMDNLQRTKAMLTAKEHEALKENAQQAAYLRAVEAVRTENDYVLEKLSKFIEQVKKSDEFNNWRLPIPKYKFNVFPGVDKQRGELLREQWLKREYITETGERNGYGTIIYAINPFLEAELVRIRTHKIPERWLTGFVNINIKSLEALDYFELIERISKINRKFQPLLERDLNELIYNYLMGHEKATIVLSGSLVELALTYYCERRKATIITLFDKAGNPKNKKLYDCVLSDLIEYVEQTKAFGNDFVHLSNLSRIYRNFIHPGRELKDSLDSSKADICFVSTREIIRRII